MKRGADILADSMARCGVRSVFGLSGDQIMPIIDAFIDQNIEFIHARHEASAVHMADGYGRIAGRPGVALVTAGPGHMNTMGGLYCARLSESPVVLISGHCHLTQLGKGAFMEAPQQETSRPLTKATLVCRNPQELGTAFREAYSLAGRGRPGPVNLIVPWDVAEGLPTYSLVEAGSETKNDTLGDVSEIVQHLQTHLETARRPLVIAGPNTSRWLRRNRLYDDIRRCGLPVLGLESPRGLNEAAHGAVGALSRDADLILLLGKRFDFSIGFLNPETFDVNAPVLQVDPDAEELSRLRREIPNPKRVVFQGLGDPIAVLEGLRASCAGLHSEWTEALQAERTYRPPEWRDAFGGGTITSFEAAEKVADGLGDFDNMILSADGGEFSQWAQAGIPARRRVINGPAAEVGGSIAMGIGASFADPDACVVVAVGDGGFGFQIADLDTVSRYGLNVKVLIGNDQKWNSEQVIQVRDYGAARAQATLMEYRGFGRIGTVFGVDGYDIEEQAALVEAIGKARAVGKGAVFNVRITGDKSPVIRRSS